MMNRFLIVLALFLTTAALGACNTAEGFGRDIEKAGEKIQEAVD